jgi:hypothetical protein
VLQEQLRKKHRATLWVTAESRTNGDLEEFHYHRVVATRSPRVEALADLLRQDAIYVSLLLQRKSGGDTYSFKLRKPAADALFPDPVTYDLLGEQNP